MNGLVFLSPYILSGLLVLPVLWWLLRATPPAPVHLKFPAVRLLMGLRDVKVMPSHTPWWLLVLRMFALGVAIIAFAEPVRNPDVQPAGNGPLLVLMDGGWGSAPEWGARVALVENTLEQAMQAGRPTVFISIAEGPPKGDDLPFRDAGEWLASLRGAAPHPWAPDREAVLNRLAATGEKFDTWWLSDGLADGRALGAELLKHGHVQVLVLPRTPLALQPLRLADGQLATTIVGVPQAAPRTVTLAVSGTAPNGTNVTFSKTPVTLEAGQSTTAVPFDLPIELRNRVTAVRIMGETSAAAVALAGEGLRRRKVALIGSGSSEGPQLVSPLFFLQKALEPSAVLIRGDLTDSLLAAPDVVVLADVGPLSQSSAAKLLAWVQNGGTLLRFAGPRLAVGVIGQAGEDPLLPVRLRAGGRALGGAMSWTTPKHLQPFPENSPFAGLHIPDDVTVNQQVVAQPTPDLAARTLAALEDGTPLVTARAEGKGRIVLFHVTANAEWSSLPISGLFVDMLERLSIGSGAAGIKVDLTGRTWLPERILDGFGLLHSPQNPGPVTGARLGQAVAGDAPPGIYRSGDSTVAVGVVRTGERLAPLELPAGLKAGYPARNETISYKPPLLLMAVLAFLLDILATLWVTGRMRNSGAVVQVIAALVFAGALPAGNARAEDDALALLGANETVLAYVRSGDPDVDRISAAGLRGLGLTLFKRTSVDPAPPVGVDIETDELGFFPLLYWPVIARQQPLSEQASGQINRYLLNGGMILFDTRDGGFAAGQQTAGGRALQRLTATLDIPPLEPVPQNHVLTRTFYLLQDFPGRWAGAPVWVAVSMPAGDQRFGDVNDGVSPVVIGANDWASAWAVDSNNRPMFPVGRGLSGNRQREMALRFGVNLVMYAMTGNYKSDQVHVPQLLERLGE